MESSKNPSTHSTEPILPPVESLQRLAISESGFVFDPVTGHSFSVNETGIQIIRLLQQGKDLNETRSELQAAYNAQQAIIERDLMEFIALLREQVDAG